MFHDHCGQIYKRQLHKESFLRKRTLISPVPPEKLMISFSWSPSSQPLSCSQAAPEAHAQLSPAPSSPAAAAEPAPPRLRGKNNVFQNFAAWCLKGPSRVAGAAEQFPWEKESLLALHSLIPKPVGLCGRENYPTPVTILGDGLTLA